MKCFQESEFRNFWFETGTPTFLVNLLKDKQTDLSRLETDLVSEISFSAYDVTNLEPYPLLVQTEYRGTYRGTGHIG